jgi:hypothetical protein
MCEISGSHGGVAEDSTLLGCYAISTGKHSPTLRRDRIAYVSVVKQSKNCRTYLTA